MLLHTWDFSTGVATPVTYDTYLHTWEITLKGYITNFKKKTWALIDYCIYIAVILRFLGAFRPLGSKGTVFKLHLD